MRRLIINADDFGLTLGVNQAIVEGSSRGVVTSATIMANSPAFDDAIALAKSTPQLRTGCHVVLIDGEAVSLDSASLTDVSGRFRTKLKDFARAALGKKMSAEDIEREAGAQICRILSQGVTLTHIDSHKHTHMFPQVLRPVLRAAKACGVRAVRNPFEPLRTWTLALLAARPGLWLRCAGVATFQMFAREFQKAVHEEGMRTTDGTVGIAATGKLDRRMLVAIISALPEGTWELVCHPGYADGDLKNAGTRLVASREVELKALTAEETKAALRKRGVELISYADITD